MILSRSSTSEGARKAKNRLIWLDFQGLIFKQIRIVFSIRRIQKTQARVVVWRGMLPLILSAVERASLDGFLLRFDPSEVGHMPIMAASRQHR